MNFIFRKITAWTLVFCLLSGSPGYSALPEPAKNSSVTLDFTQLNLPRHLGRVDEIYDVPESLKKIILIQDAHCNFDAQRNIRGILHYFQEKNALPLVAFEGGEGEMDLLALRAFPGDAVKFKVLEDYAQRGELSGAEMAAVLNPHESAYFAAEDFSVYESNRNAFLEANRALPEYEQNLNRLEESLNRLREKFFSPQLKEFSKVIYAARQDSADYFSQITYLLKKIRQYDLSLKEFPELKKYARHVRLEKEFQKENSPLTVQAAAWLAAARQKIPALLRTEEKKAFARVLQELDTGAAQQYWAVYRLWKIAGEAGGSLPFDNELAEVFQDLRDPEETDGMIFFQELESAARAVAGRIYQNPAEKELDALFGKYFLLRRLSRLHMTRQDANAYFLRQQEYAPPAFNDFFARHGEKAADFAFPEAETFYRAALHRDSILLRNLLRRLEKGKLAAAAMIIGGFHSQGIKEQLRAAGISYVLITPSIRAPGGEENYSRVMRGDLSYLNAAEKNARMQALARGAEPAALAVQLRDWRALIIQRMLARGPAAASAEYTRYVDALTAALAGEMRPAALGAEIAALGKHREEFFQAVSMDFLAEAARGVFQEGIRVDDFARKLEELNREMLGSAALREALGRDADEQLAELSGLISRDLRSFSGLLGDLSALHASGNLTEEKFRAVFLAGMEQRTELIRGLLAGYQASAGTVSEQELLDRLAGQTLETLMQAKVDMAEEYLGIKDPEAIRKVNDIFTAFENKNSRPVSRKEQLAYRLALLEQALDQKQSAVLPLAHTQPQPAALGKIAVPDAAAALGIDVERSFDVSLRDKLHLEKNTGSFYVDFLENGWLRVRHLAFAEAAGEREAYESFLIKLKKDRIQEIIYEGIAEEGGQFKKISSARMLKRSWLRLRSLSGSARIHAEQLASLEWAALALTDAANRKYLTRKERKVLWQAAYEFVKMARSGAAFRDQSLNPDVSNVERAVFRARGIARHHDWLFDKMLELTNADPQGSKKVDLSRTLIPGGTLALAVSLSFLGWLAWQGIAAILLMGVIALFASDIYLQSDYRRQTRGNLKLVRQVMDFTAYAEFRNGFFKGSGPLPLYIRELKQKINNSEEITFGEAVILRDHFFSAIDRIKAGAGDIEYIQAYRELVQRIFREDIFFRYVSDNDLTVFSKEKISRYPVLNFLQTLEYVLPGVKSREGGLARFDSVSASALGAVETDRIPAEIKKAVLRDLRRLGYTGDVESLFAVTRLDPSASGRQNIFAFEDPSSKIQLALLEEDFKNRILEKAAQGDRNMVFYVIGLGSQPKETIELMEAFTKVLRSLPEEDPRQWTVDLIAADLAEDALRRAEEKFREELEPLRQESGLNLNWTLQQADIFDRTQLETVLREAGQGKKGDYIIHRNVTYLNRLRGNGGSSVFSPWVILHVDDPSVSDMVMAYVVTRNLTDIFARTGSRVVIEPDYNLGTDDRRQTIYRVPHSRILSVTDLRPDLLKRRVVEDTVGNLGSGIFLLRDTQPATFIEFLEEIEGKKVTPSLSRLLWYVSGKYFRKALERIGHALNPFSWNVRQAVPPEESAVIPAPDKKADDSASLGVEAAAANEIRYSLVSGRTPNSGNAIVIRLPGNKAVLLDTGIEPDKADDLKQALNGDELTAVIVTHAHRDHSLGTPWINEIYPGAAFMATDVTARILQPLWADALQHDRRKADSWMSRRQISQALRNLRQVRSDSWYEITPGVKIYLDSAGHIPGAVSVTLLTPRTKIVYTGDADGSLKISKGKGADLLISESTNGGKNFPDLEIRKQELINEVGETFQRGGTVLVPAFAVGRSSNITYILEQAIRGGALPGNTKIYLDGLARGVIRQLMNTGNFPHMNDWFTPGSPVQEITSESQRQRVLERALAGEPVVFIAGSGMLEGGVAKRIAFEIMEDPKNTVIMVGYQAPKTLGAALLDPQNRGQEFSFDLRETKSILWTQPAAGRDIKILNARVIKIGFSGHSGHDSLVEMIFDAEAGQVFLVHGDDSAKEALREDEFLKATQKFVAEPSAGQELIFRASQDRRAEFAKAPARPLPAPGWPEVEKRREEYAADWITALAVPLSAGTGLSEAQEISELIEVYFSGTDNLRELDRRWYALFSIYEDPAYSLEKAEAFLRKPAQPEQKIRPAKKAAPAPAKPPKIKPDHWTRRDREGQGWQKIISQHLGLRAPSDEIKEDPPSLSEEFARLLALLERSRFQNMAAQILSAHDGEMSYLQDEAFLKKHLPLLRQMAFDRVNEVIESYWTSHIPGWDPDREVGALRSSLQGLWKNPDRAWEILRLAQEWSQNLSGQVPENLEEQAYFRILAFFTANGEASASQRNQVLSVLLARQGKAAVWKRILEGTQPTPEEIAEAAASLGVLTEIPKAGKGKGHIRDLVKPEHLREVAEMLTQEDPTLRPLDTAGNPGGLRYAARADSVLHISDVHGRYDVLEAILSQEKVLERWRQGEKLHLVFGGDMVHPENDFSPSLHRDSFDPFLLYVYLKRQYPEFVHFIPGNHEIASLPESGLTIFKALKYGDHDRYRTYRGLRDENVRLKLMTPQDAERQFIRNMDRAMMPFHPELLDALDRVKEGRRKRGLSALNLSLFQLFQQPGAFEKIVEIGFDRGEEYLTHYRSIIERSPLAIKVTHGNTQKAPGIAIIHASAADINHRSDLVNIYIDADGKLLRSVYLNEALGDLVQGRFYDGARIESFKRALHVDWISSGHSNPAKAAQIVEELYEDVSLKTLAAGVPLSVGAVIHAGQTVIESLPEQNVASYAAYDLRDFSGDAEEAMDSIRTVSLGFQPEKASSLGVLEQEQADFAGELIEQAGIKISSAMKLWLEKNADQLAIYLAHQLFVSHQQLTPSSPEEKRRLSIYQRLSDKVSFFRVKWMVSRKLRAEPAVMEGLRSGIAKAVARYYYRYYFLPAEPEIDVYHNVPLYRSIGEMRDEILRAEDSLAVGAGVEEGIYWITEYRKGRGKNRMVLADINNFVTAALEEYRKLTQTDSRWQDNVSVLSWDAASDTPPELQRKFNLVMIARVLYQLGRVSAGWSEMTEKMHAVPVDSLEAKAARKKLYENIVRLLARRGTAVIFEAGQERDGDFHPGIVEDEVNDIPGLVVERMSVDPYPAGDSRIDYALIVRRTSAGASLGATQTVIFPSYGNIRANADTAWSISTRHVLTRQGSIVLDADLMRQIGISAGEKVFGFAGHTGRWLGELAKLGAVVTYSDISERSAAAVRDHPEAQQLFKEIISVNAIDAPANPDEYDWSLSFEPIPMYDAEQGFEIAALRALQNRRGLKIIDRDASGNGVGGYFTSLSGRLRGLLALYGVSETDLNRHVYSANIKWFDAEAQQEQAAWILTLETSPEVRELAARDLKIMDALNKNGDLSALNLSEAEIAESLDRIEKLTIDFKLPSLRMNLKLAADGAALGGEQKTEEAFSHLIKSLLAEKYPQLKTLLPEIPELSAEEQEKALTEFFALSQDKQQEVFARLEKDITGLLRAASQAAELDYDALSRQILFAGLDEEKINLLLTAARARGAEITPRAREDFVSRLRGVLSGAVARASEDSGLLRAAMEELAGINLSTEELNEAFTRLLESRGLADAAADTPDSLAAALDVRSLPRELDAETARQIMVHAGKEGKVTLIFKRNSAQAETAARFAEFLDKDLKDNLIRAPYVAGIAPDVKRILSRMRAGGAAARVLILPDYQALQEQMKDAKDPDAALYQFSAAEIPDSVSRLALSFMMAAALKKQLADFSVKQTLDNGVEVLVFNAAAFITVLAAEARAIRAKLDTAA